MAVFSLFWPALQSHPSITELALDCREHLCEGPSFAILCRSISHQDLLMEGMGSRGGRALTEENIHGSASPAEAILYGLALLGFFIIVSYDTYIRSGTIFLQVHMFETWESSHFIS
jgi:hypothetical protein